MARNINERVLRYIGWIATITAILMYGSYLDQINLNLTGSKGSVIQPLATVLNTSLWSTYGWLQPKRDWPIGVCCE